MSDPWPAPTIKASTSSSEAHAWLVCKSRRRKTRSSTNNTNFFTTDPQVFEGKTQAPVTRAHYGIRYAAV